MIMNFCFALNISSWGMSAFFSGFSTYHAEWSAAAAAAAAAAFLHNLCDNTLLLATAGSVVFSASIEAVVL